jgi:hypothetical protein
MRTWEAYTPVSDRPVRTFSDKDLAEAYRDRMAALGTVITVKKARIDRRAA